MSKTIEDVKDFWESNPLWAGESRFPAGSKEFFDEHREIYIADCFAGTFDLRFLPPPRPNGQNIRILDLGCGIGFWTVELGMRGINNIVAGDLTLRAVEMTEQRCDLFGVKAEIFQLNAEKIDFPDESFDHVNCQGVIHHTPDTQKSVAEIARVLKIGGTACISVYYRNFFLRAWPFLRWIGKILTVFGGGLKGRGREKIFSEGDVDEIIRLYDGNENPIGKSYSKESLEHMLSTYFVVDEIYLHFFPARALPFKLPRWLHKWLDRNVGFMVYATVRKTCAVSPE